MKPWPRGEKTNFRAAHHHEVLELRQLRILLALEPVANERLHLFPAHLLVHGHAAAREQHRTFAFRLVPRQHRLFAEEETQRVRLHAERKVVDSERTSGFVAYQALTLCWVRMLSVSSAGPYMSGRGSLQSVVVMKTL